MLISALLASANRAMPANSAGGTAGAPTRTTSSSGPSDSARRAGSTTIAALSATST